MHIGLLVVDKVGELEWRSASNGNEFQRTYLSVGTVRSHDKLDVPMPHDPPNELCNLCRINPHALSRSFLPYRGCGLWFARLVALPSRVAKLGLCLLEFGIHVEKRLRAASRPGTAVFGTSGKRPRSTGRRSGKRAWIPSSRSVEHLPRSGHGQTVEDEDRSDPHILEALHLLFDDAREGGRVASDSCDHGLTVVLAREELPDIVVDVDAETGVLEHLEGQPLHLLRRREPSFGRGERGAAGKRDGHTFESSDGHDGDGREGRCGE